MTTPVNLPFKLIKGSPTTTLFLHGFLGSHKNFTKLARQVHKHLNHTTYALDLRNHGLATPQTPNEMNYTILAQDLQRFIQQHDLPPKVNLVGFSMGAKTAMLLNLQAPHLINTLVCLDNSPITNDIGPTFPAYIRAMKEFSRWTRERLIPQGEMTDKQWFKSGFEKMRDLLHGDESMAMYLFGNFQVVKSTQHHGFELKSKVPLEAIDESWFSMLGDFPSIESFEPVRNKARFVKAKESEYVNEEAVGIIKRWFPNHGEPVVQEISGRHDDVLVGSFDETCEIVLKELA